MLSITLFILLILFITISASYWFKSTFGKMVPYSCLSVSLLVFFLTAIFYSFKLAVIIIYCGASISFVITYLLNRKNFFNNLKNNCINGIIVFIFIVLACLFLAIVHGERPLNWDDYMHWGPMVKDIYNNDYFYITENSKVFIHSDYPPIISVFNAICVIFECNFVAKNVFFSMFLLQALMLMPIVSENEFRISSIKFVIYILSFIYLFEIGLGGSFFFSLSQDCIMGLITGLTLYNVICSKIDKNFWISIFLLISSLLLIKQFNLVLVLIIVVALVARFINDGIKDKKRWFALFLTLLCSFVPYFTWQIIYQNSYAAENLAAQFHFSSFGVIFSNPIIAFYENTLTVWKFTCALFTHSLIDYFPIKIPYVAILVILPLIMYFILKNNKKKFLILFILIITLVLYAFFLCLTYMFVFCGEDKDKLLSVDRYLSSAVLSVFCLSFFFVVSHVEDKCLSLHCRYKILLAFIPVVCCLMFPSILKNNIFTHYLRNEEALKIETIAKDKLWENSNTIVIDCSITEKDAMEISYNLDKYWVSYILKSIQNDTNLKYINRQPYKDIPSMEINSQIDFFDKSNISMVFENVDYILTGKLSKDIKDKIFSILGYNLEDDALYELNGSLLTKVY